MRTRTPAPLVASSVMALALLVGVAVPVAASGAPPPPTTTGRVGPWSVVDSATAPNVTCLYVEEFLPPSTVTWTAYRFNVRPPRLRWPNTNPDVDHQHGRVGWRISLWNAPSVAGPWELLLSGAVTKLTAWEDQKAAFTQKYLTWDPSNETTGIFRIRSRFYWYRADGSVRGRVTYWSEWYRLGGDLIGQAPRYAECPAALAIA